MNWAWIATADRKPTTSHLVVVCRTNGPFGSERLGLAHYVPSQDKWILLSDDWNQSSVAYWMPLPTLPPQE